MGYTLMIGEYAPEFIDEDGQTCILQACRKERHEGAPAHGEPTDNTNERWPSYTTWLEFSRFMKLQPLFAELLREHPGCVPLVLRHKRAVDAAVQRMQWEYPDMEPGFSTGYSEGDPRPYLARLSWLSYWIDWALENCQHPVFYNS